MMKPSMTWVRTFGFIIAFGRSLDPLLLLDVVVVVVLVQLVVEELQLVVVVLAVEPAVVPAVVLVIPIPLLIVVVVGVDVADVEPTEAATLGSSFPLALVGVELLLVGCTALLCLLVGVVATFEGVEARSEASPLGRASLVELLASTGALTLAGVEDLGVVQVSCADTGVMGESMGTRVAVGPFECVSLVGVAGKLPPPLLALLRVTS